MLKMYNDRYPLLKARKHILYAYKSFSHLCFMIIKNKVFEAIILTVIFFNTIILMIADPNVDVYFDDFFVYFYTAEMSLKILGLGFILSKGTYLRDGWNVLDFVIVTSSLLPYLLNGKTSFSLSSLRSLRILRPLRAISSISALKVYLY